MFFSEGNNSDGGIKYYIPAGTADGTTFLIPSGVGGKYTPTVVTVSGVADDGYIQINPVDKELKTTDPTGGDLLSYYWRVRFESFDTPPTVIYDFYYDESDLDGSTNEALFVAGKVIAQPPFNRSYEDDNIPESEFIDNSNNIIHFNGPLDSGITLEETNYTAGESNRFIGQPNVYYTNAWYQNWNNGAIWHKDSKGSGDTGTVPEEGSVAIIYRDGVGNQARVWGNGLVAEPAEIRFEHDYDAYPDPNSENQVRLQFNNPGTYNLGNVSGTGMISFDSPDAISINGDFGEFGNNDESTFLYFGGGATLTNIPTPIPNLMFEGGGKTIDQTINVGADLIIQGNTILYPIQDITIDRDLVLGFWGGGTLQFPGSGAPITIDVARNIDFTQYLDNGNRRIWVADNTANIENKLIVRGDIIHGSNNGANREIRLWRADNKSKVILELSGEGQHSYARTDATQPILYRIDMNKGNDQSHTFTFEEDFTLNGTTNGAGIDKALEMYNGTLVLDDADISFDLTTGDDHFYIPATSSLELKQGTYTCNGGSGILLDGKLTINGAALDMSGGNNPIEYSASGNAELYISSGSLTVGSQIRGGTTADEGILKYTQIGGTVIVGENSAPENNRGIFEIHNNGSEFNFTGGTLEVQRAQSSATRAAVFLDPEVSTIAPSMTIKLGNNNTPAGQDIGIASTVSIPNLTIDNSSGNAPSAKIWVQSLNIDNDLTIENGTTFNADGYDLYIGGDMINNGTYTPSSNTTYFNGTNTQSISGSSSTTFYNFTKSGNDDLSVQQNIIITKDCDVSDGSVSDNSNNISIHGDFNLDGIHNFGGTGNGIELNGSAKQYLSGNGTFGMITLNNSSGAEFQPGYSPVINDGLRLEEGVLDIGANLLTLAVNADVIPVNPFGDDNMIQTTKSYVDAGVKKIFPSYSGAGFNYIIPLGSNGIYCPVTFDITNNDNNTGNITVKASHETHPSVIDDVEAPNIEIVDAANTLRFYWILRSSGINGFSGSIKFSAADSLAKVAEASYSQADYITARLLNDGSFNWDKFEQSTYDETLDELNFTFSATNDLGISGDYTAGVEPQNLDRKGAIPDQVPLYTTIADGNWVDPIWTPTAPAGGPRGSRVQIDHEVTISTNFTSTYITTLSATGQLNLGTTFGHRLGDVFGNGLIHIESGNIPSGYYLDFTSATGGTFEFDGNTDYSVLSNFTSVNNLIFSGTGERKLPNGNLTVVGDITINGDDASLKLVNQYSKTYYLNKDFTLTTGSFDANTGANAIFVFNGSSAQNITGDFIGTSSFHKLQINNANGINLGSNIEINDVLYLSNGNINSSAANMLTIINPAQLAVVGGGTSSFVDGPMRKLVSQGEGFTFPLGDGGRYGEVGIGNNTNISTALWETEYYNASAATDGRDPLNIAGSITSVSTNEYWRVKAPSPTLKSDVTIRWDAFSGMTPDPNDSRIATWNDGGSYWEDVNSTINAGNKTMKTSLLQNFNEETTGNYFTFAQIAIFNLIWTGTVSDQWENKDNWSPDRAPSATINVTIPDVSSGSNTYPVIRSNTDVNALQLDAPASLDIAPGYSLTLHSDFNFNGTLNIQADQANGAGQLLDNGTITGSGTANVYFPVRNKRYTMISSPLSSASSATVNTHSGKTGENFYWFDENVDERTLNNDIRDGWTTVSGALSVGQGYAFAWVHGDRNIQFQGGNLNTGTYNAINITNTAYGIASDGWNLLGNPYPSNLDAASFVAANSTAIGALYFWDDDNTLGTDFTSADYATWNLAGSLSGASAIEGGTGTVPNGIIPVGQAFFVSASSSAFIEFNNTMRTVSSAPVFNKKNEETASIKRIKLSVNNNEFYNELMVAQTSNATDGYDMHWDARKMRQNQNIALFSYLGSKEYAIQSIGEFADWDEVKTIPLGLYTRITGAMEFNSESLENIDDFTYVYLKDKQVNQLIDLKTEQTYQFNTARQNIPNRFELVLAQEPITIDDIAQQNPIKIFADRDEVVVTLNSKEKPRGTILISTLTGQLVKTIELTNQYQYNIPVSNNSGIYLIKVINNGKVNSGKVFLLN